jgi:hypothetical protein
VAAQLVASRAVLSSTELVLVIVFINALLRWDLVSNESPCTCY